MNASPSEIVLYTTVDGQVKIDTVFQNETIWLTQARMAELFDVKIPAISKHLKNILSTWFGKLTTASSRHRFETGELDEKVVISILEHTTQNSNFYLTVTHA